MLQSRVPLSRSCRACIKAKKRCDLVVPRCGRCEEKKIGCAYANEPLRPDVKKATRVTACRATDESNHKGIVRPKRIIQRDPRLSRLEPIDESTTLLDRVQPTFHGVPLSLDEDTVQYMGAMFRKVPALFVLGGKTPSLDMTVYGQSMPATMKEIYGVCEILITKIVDGKVASRLLDAQTPGMPSSIASFVSAMLSAY